MISEIYSRHIDTIYRLCYILTGSRADAEDAVQAVFLKLIESGKSFNDMEHEKAWLIVTTKNHCRDLHRKWWKRNVVSGGIEIEGQYSQTFQSSEIWSCLLKLPQPHRILLYLHYFEGYKLSEIAKLLKLNENTVKSRLRKAKACLKLEIGDE
jgi:RNA polymerase sigma-70 factor (ECF subfamily)